MTGRMSSSGWNLSSSLRPGQVLGVDVPGHEAQPAGLQVDPRADHLVCSLVSSSQSTSNAMITSYRARLYHLVAGSSAGFSSTVPAGPGSG